MHTEQKTINQSDLTKPFWAMQPEGVLHALGARSEGLDPSEAEKRLRIFGKNIIKTKRRLTKTRIVLNQLKSPLIMILIISGGIMIAVGEFVNTIVIFAAVIVNTTLGFWQENKAEHALELLKSYIRTRVRVRRGTGEREIDASELVPGDVIRIVQGDRVPADARLLFVNSLEMDEATLTGESMPVEKDIGPVPEETGISSQASMVFGGTLVTTGFADAVVTLTGGETQFGAIAAMVAEAPEPSTPLQRAVADFARVVGITLIGLTAGLFSIGLYAGYGLLEMFLIAVAVAVSAVPEGLPVALTVILAIGVERLAKKKGVVRKLLAAETLGSTTLILTDKTGTLTQATMELVDIMPAGGSDKHARHRLLREALLNLDVILENPDDPPREWRMFGNPVEIALVKGAAAEGILLPSLLKETRMVDRRPFSSESKFSITVSHIDSRHHVSMLGAPEVIIRFAAIDDKKKEEIISVINAHAREGKRIIGVASKERLGDKEVIHEDRTLGGYDFEGILVLEDPLRPTVKHAIKRIAEQGVKTIIVTGDHQGTAEHVGRELGLVGDDPAVLTGEKMATLTPEQLRTKASHTAVYARVTPQQKMQLVTLYRELGEVVAVTGDGINDAPALRAADIGIAVGSGTDVTKSAADLVILDDNFETIVAAIEEGRKILSNIRKVIIYLLSDSLDEILLIGGALLTGLPLPLNALQILFVNFFSDSFPAVAFAFEQGAGDAHHKARKSSGRIFDSTMSIFILVIGIPTSAVLFFLYYALLYYEFDPALVRTFIFGSFASYTLFLSFALRSIDRSIIRYNPFSNRYLTIGVGIGIMLTVGSIYIPTFQRVFDIVPLPPLWLLGVFAMGCFNIGVIEAGKMFLGRRRKEK